MGEGELYKKIRYKVEDDYDFYFPFDPDIKEVLDLAKQTFPSPIISMEDMAKLRNLAIEGKLMEMMHFISDRYCTPRGIWFVEQFGDSE